MADIGEKLNEFHDQSGLITVSVFKLQAQNEQKNFTDFGVNVTGDMVAVGGGGTAVESPEGALLTASYPNDDLSGWLVSSREHITPNAHRLTAYAIGMKIKGMSRDQLMNYVFVNAAHSEFTEHPEVTTTRPNNKYVLINGGFKVENQGYTGNFGTASFPEAPEYNSWRARSTDHGPFAEDYEFLKVYGIAIKQQLPLGNVLSSFQLANSATVKHPAAAANLAPGFALCGGGAEVRYNGPGVLLWKLEPTTNNVQSFTAASKDHVEPDTGTITTYAIGIQLQPI